MLEGWVGAIVSVFLVLLSGLFSGLSLAWMNSDRDRLEVLKNGGTQEQQRYANAVVPVRVGQANQLLVALLLTNVVVNAGLTAVLIAVTSVPIGFGIASALILLFGELIPQLFVSRHALVTAAKTLWLVKLIIVLTLFINWPLGKVIDWLVGEEVSHYMTKDEIRELVHRGKDVEMNAAKIMTGALNLHEKQAKDVMTSLKDVYRLEVNEKLDTNTLLTVFNSGYSRIPCYDSKRRSDPTIGLLFVKDLILLDPKDAIPLNTVLKLYGRDVIQVFPDTPLDKMLELFKTGKSHLAIVHDVNDQGDGDPFYEEIGIITLEDIIETILQDNIVDETDVYINVAADKKELTNRKLPDVSALHGLSRRQLPNVLTPQELSAVYFHLRGNIAIFKPNDSSGCLLSSKALKKMLGVSQVIHVNIEQHKKKEAGGKSEVSQSAANARIIDIARGGDYICVKGRPTDCMTVILEGRIRQPHIIPTHSHTRVVDTIRTHAHTDTKHAYTHTNTHTHSLTHTHTHTR